MHVFVSGHSPGGVFLDHFDVCVRACMYLCAVTHPVGSFSTTLMCACVPACSVCMATHPVGSFSSTLMCVCVCVCVSVFVCGHSPGGVFLDHLDAFETLKDLAGDGRGTTTEVAGTRSVALAACDIATAMYQINNNTKK